MTSSCFRGWRSVRSSCEARTWGGRARAGAPQPRGLAPRSVGSRSCSSCSPATRPPPTAGRSPRPPTRKRSASRARPISAPTSASASPVSPGSRPAAAGRRRRRALAAEAIAAVGRARTRGCTRCGRPPRSASSSSASATPRGRAEHFEDQRRLLRELGITDVDLSPAAELVDAYVRLGRDNDAELGRGPVHDRGGGEGPAVVTGTRAALPRPGGRRRRLRRAVRAGAPPPRPHARRVRDGAHAARVRRSACGEPAIASWPAISCGPRSTRSSASTPGRGPNRHGPSWPRPARRCGGATPARSTS